MRDEEIIKLAIECGIGDKDLSEDGSVVSDYGDITENVIEFSARLLAMAKLSGQ